MASITLVNERPSPFIADLPTQTVQWTALWLAVLPFTLCLGVVLASVMIPRNCLLIARRAFV